MSNELQIQQSQEQKFDMRMFDDSNWSCSLGKGYLLFSEIWPQEVEKFNSALQKYPTIDLGCGGAPQKKTYNALFKKEFPYEWENIDKLKDSFSKIVEPLFYYGIDLYHVPKTSLIKSENTAYFRDEATKFMSALPENSVNVMSGALSPVINHRCRFNEDENKWNKKFALQILRIIAPGGYYLSIYSPLAIETGSKILEELGLETIPKNVTQKFLNNIDERIYNGDGGGAEFALCRSYLFRKKENSDATPPSETHKIIESYVNSKNNVHQ